MQIQSAIEGLPFDMLKDEGKPKGNLPKPVWKAWGCESFLPFVTYPSLCLLLSLTIPYLTWPDKALLGLTGPYWALLDLTGPYWALFCLGDELLSVNGTILKGFSLNEVKIERVDIRCKVQTTISVHCTVSQVYEVLDSSHGGELLYCVARRS